MLSNYKRLGYLFYNAIRTILFSAVTSYFIISCQSTTDSIPSKYPARMIGDIQQDSLLDDPNFKACKDLLAIQYFSFGEKTFEGEKIKIVRIFQELYQPENAAKESGLIRIRFLVNCKGESGRFRLMGMDENYQDKTFDASITDQLMRITKGLTGWKTFPEHNRDYYQYLIFKIKNGKLIEIMP